MKISVLILIVLEDGLVLHGISVHSLIVICLNPYCIGRWSRTGSSFEQKFKHH